MGKILVTYASKYQSTAEIADRIAKVLSKSGLKVELRSVFVVDNVAEYDAVVMGSAIYMGQWMKESMNFLATYVEFLKLRPVWVFSSGPTGDGNPSEILDGFLLPEKVKPYMKRIMPRDIKLFHGNLDLKRLNFGERLLIKSIRAKIGDYRNWDDIEVWATQIAQALNEEKVY